jgi:Tol biopolymer transport system component
VSVDGTSNFFTAAFGSYPTWNSTSTEILYGTRAIDQSGMSFGDSLWVYSILNGQSDFFKFIAGESRHCQYSPDGTRIGFWSTGGNETQGDLWVMNSDGTTPEELTTEGVDVDFGIPFSWSPDGFSIAYTSYRASDYSFANGTIWIIDIRTRVKRQLTYNYPPTHFWKQYSRRSIR